MSFLNGLASSAGLNVNIDHSTDQAIQRIIEELDLKDQLRSTSLALRVALAALTKRCNDSLETIQDEVRNTLWWLRILIMVWVVWYALQILAWLRTAILVVGLLGVVVLSLKLRVRNTSSDESKQESEADSKPDSQEEDEGAKEDGRKKNECADPDDEEDEVDAEDFASFLVKSGLGLLTLRLRRLMLLKHLHDIIEARESSD